MSQPFDSQQDLNSRLHAALVESTSVPGQAAMTIVGPGGGAIAVSIGGGLPALTPSSAQVNIAVTGTAVALAGVATQVDLLHIIANITNGNNIFLGPSTVTSANGLILEPGRGVTLENADLSTVFINGTAPDGISRLALT